jgi:hypothetical protein
VTYVFVLATQGTTGGTMQVLGTDLAPPFARGRSSPSGGPSHSWGRR